MDQFVKENPMIIIFFILGLLIVMILMVVAVLKIPRIAKYQRAQLMLLSISAKDKGMAVDKIRSILNDADPEILSDPSFEPLIKAEE